MEHLSCSLFGKCARLAQSSEIGGIWLITSQQMLVRLQAAVMLTDTGPSAPRSSGGRLSAPRQRKGERTVTPSSSLVGPAALINLSESPTTWRTAVNAQARQNASCRASRLCPESPQPPGADTLLIAPQWALRAVPKELVSSPHQGGRASSKCVRHTSLCCGGSRQTFF